MRIFFAIFILFLSKRTFAQERCFVDTFDVSNKVGFIASYDKIYDFFPTNRFASVHYDSNFLYKFIDYEFKVQVVDYHLPSTNILVYPFYGNKTRELAEYLKTQPISAHDSLVYGYLREEMRPNHFSSGGCLRYKISPLKKWQGQYPYVDTEEVYATEEGGELTFSTHFYRLLWVDSCQYEFSVVTYDEKKRELAKSRRCVRHNFKRLVETVYVRREDELLDLQPPK